MWTTSTGETKGGKRVKGTGTENEGGDNEGSDKVKVFPHMSNSPQINSPLSLIFIRIFLGALTCRGPPAGIVDLSDVRSMSRP